MSQGIKLNPMLAKDVQVDPNGITLFLDSETSKVSTKTADSTVTEIGSGSGGGVSEFELLEGDKTLSLADVGKAFYSNAEEVRNITVPLDATADIPVGTQFIFLTTSTGVITFIPEDTGEALALLTSADDLFSTRTRYSVVTLMKRDLDTWILYGDLDE